MVEFSVDIGEKERLTGSNFLEWKLKIKSILQLKRLYRLVTRDETDEEAESLNKQDPNRKADAMAFLMLSCDMKIVTQFAPQANDDPCVFWELLEQLYQQTLQRQSTYLNRIFATALTSENLEANLNDVYKNAQDLYKLIDDNKASMLLDGAIATWAIVNLPNDLKGAGELVTNKCDNQKRLPTMKETIEEICQYLQKHKSLKELGTTEASDVPQTAPDATLAEKQIGQEELFSQNDQEKDGAQVAKDEPNKPVSVETKEQPNENSTAPPSSVENDHHESDNVAPDIEDSDQGASNSVKVKQSSIKDETNDELPNDTVSVEAEEDDENSTTPPSSAENDHYGISHIVAPAIKDSNQGPSYSAKGKQSKITQVSGECLKKLDPYSLMLETNDMLRDLDVSMTKLTKNMFKIDRITPIRIPSVIPSHLSPDQVKVFNEVLKGHSVFFTGSAGSGKSHLLEEIANHFKKNSTKKVYVTASTPMAACAIKGTTLQSFADVEKDRDYVGYHQPPALTPKSEASKQRWRSVDVLIIDEVSTIDGDWFKQLNAMAKSVRKTYLPFGGIQLIPTGDFFQLLPPRTIGTYGSSYKDPSYIFNSHSWNECVTKTFVIKGRFRQSDPAFVDILEDIRYGDVSQHTKLVLQLRHRHLLWPDKIEPVTICSDESSACKINKNALAKLYTSIVIFKSKDRSGNDSSIDTKALRQKLDENLVVSENLVLLTGAQVMLVKDLPDDGLVAGSMGIITRFVDKEQFQESADDNLGFDLSEFQNDHQGWPEVLFTNGKKKILTPHAFSIGDLSGNPDATRVQVPLILAWALSLDQCRGVSLDRVSVSYTSRLLPGQFYAALSRATSLNDTVVIPETRDSYSASFNYDYPIDANKAAVEWAQKNLKLEI